MKKSRRKRTSTKKIAKSTKTFVTKAITRASKTFDVKYNSYFDNSTALINGLAYQENAPYAIQMCAMPLGTGDQDRIGSQIKINWIKFNYVISAYNIAANMANICNMFRYVVFQDMGCQGATPTINDMFYPNNSGIALTNQSYNLMVAEFNHSYVGKPNDSRSKRFRIFYDKVFKVGEANGPQEIIHIRKTIRFKKPLVCNYLLTTGNTTAIGPGSLWILVMPGISTTVGNNPYYQGYVEMQYTD